MSAIDLQKINREMEKKKRWVQSFWGEVRDGGGIVYMAVSSPWRKGGTDLPRPAMENPINLVRTTCRLMRWDQPIPLLIIQDEEWINWGFSFLGGAISLFPPDRP